MNALKKNSKGKAFVPKGFPDWKRVEEYGDYKTWSNRRWAWEFLRRNKDYWAACDMLRHGSHSSQTTAREQAAAEFGRCDLKHYQKPYLSDDEDRHWLAESVADWEVFRPLNGGAREHHLKPGQVSIVFDVTQAEVAGTAAITAMTDHAHNILMSELKEYVERNLYGPSGAALRRDKKNWPRVKTRRPKKDAETRIQWLRIYDAIEIWNATRDEAIKRMFSPIATDEDPVDITLANQKKISAHLVRVREIVNGDYRALVPLDYIQNKASKKVQQASTDV